jgi:hypothetical protein
VSYRNNVSSSEKPITKQPKINRSNNKIKEDIKNQYNHLMLLSNENRNVRNISVEDQKSHKHSLLEVEALSKYVCDPIILKKDVYNSKDN